MKPIAIFYHGLFYIGDPPQKLPSAEEIIRYQMRRATACGLIEAASEFHVGINGGKESGQLARQTFPDKAKLFFHGLESRAENLTLVLLEEWVKTHPGWNVLYFHAKGSTHNPGSDYGRMAGKWRDGMMEDLILNWRTCVKDLETHEVACSHFMRGMGWDKSQNIAAGNFWWATSDFLATVPTIYLRERIKQDGIAALSSRYEAEVWISNGKIPTVKEYRPNGGHGVP